MLPRSWSPWFDSRRAIDYQVIRQHDFPMDLDRDNPLAIEILQEIGENYFAACRKMLDSIEALKAFDRTFVSSVLDGASITRRTVLLANAVERVYFVVIQREAMNLSGLEEFYEAYAVPGEVRERFGPRLKHE